MQLSANDTLVWRVEKGKDIFAPVQRNFLRDKNAIKTGTGDIAADRERARTERLKKYL